MARSSTKFVRQGCRLAVGIAKNHRLVDANKNKRLAWAALNMFVMLNGHSVNGHSLRVATDDAVVTMLAVAAGDLDEAAASTWLAARLDQPDG